MNRTPKIGDRVRYKGRPSLPSCVGTVLYIYKNYEWDEDRQTEGKLLPQREWQVRMKVDKLPDPWPYVGTDLFAPDVKDLTYE